MKELLSHLRVEFKKHLFDYLILITAGVFFLLALHTFQGERVIEVLILFSFVTLYIVWGIHHHIIEETLHLKTVIEYILIGFIFMFLMKIIILP